MERRNIQLVFTRESITVNAVLFDGVLTTKTFEGANGYLQLYEFLKNTFPGEPIDAQISVR